MAASEVYKSKFPATKQLDACYSDVVPDKGVHHATVQMLENALSEKSTFILINAHLTFILAHVLQNTILLLRASTQFAMPLIQHMMKIYYCQKG